MIIIKVRKLEVSPYPHVTILLVLKRVPGYPFRALFRISVKKWRSSEACNVFSHWKASLLIQRLVAVI